MALRGAERVNLASVAAAHNAFVKKVFPGKGPLSLIPPVLVREMAEEVGFPTRFVDPMKDILDFGSTVVSPNSKPSIGILNRWAISTISNVTRELKSLAQKTLPGSNDGIVYLLKEKIAEIGNLRGQLLKEFEDWMQERGHAQGNRVICLVEAITESCLQPKFLGELDGALEKLKDCDSIEELRDGLNDFYLAQLLRLRVAAKMAKIAEGPVRGLSFHFMESLCKNEPNTPPPSPYMSWEEVMLEDFDRGGL